MAIWVIIAIIVSLIVFLYWGQSGGVHSAFIRGACDRSDLANPADLKIVSYNIAYGRGIKDDKGDLRSARVIEKNLSEIADVISNLDADIVLLQEVDFGSKRTHHIDEAEYIAGRAGFNCYACVTTWVKNYVPYPYWPIGQQYGEMKSGQCVLSKYPIVENRRLPLPPMTSAPFFYRAFYLDRALQQVKIEIGGQNIVVYNVHLEAFDIENREEQAAKAASLIEKSKYVVIGGDFNALPPDATVKKDFSDNPGGSWRDVTDDKTVEIFNSGLAGFEEAAEADITEPDTFTYPADFPNRKIDHIFFSEGFECLNGRVVKEAGPLSDHLPVEVSLKRLL